MRRKGQESFGYIIALMLFIAITLIGVIMLFFSHGMKKQFVRQNMGDDEEYHDLTILVNSLLRFEVNLPVKEGHERMMLADAIVLNTGGEYKDTIEDMFKIFFARYIKVAGDNATIVVLNVKIPSQDIELKLGEDNKCNKKMMKDKLTLPGESGKEDIDIEFEGCSGMLGKK